MERDWQTSSKSEAKRFSTSERQCRQSTSIVIGQPYVHHLVEKAQQSLCSHLVDAFKCLAVKGVAAQEEEILLESPSASFRQSFY